MIHAILYVKKKELMRILHPDWTGDDHPPEDEELSNLFNEPSLALEKVLQSLSRVEPEEMTTEWMEITEANLDRLEQHADAMEEKLDLLIDRFKDHDPAAARNHIRLLLERNQ